MKHIFLKEEVHFLLLYVFLIISHHILPNVIGQFAFIVSFIFFFFSRNNYFWLALFTLILSSAAGFFSIFVKFIMVGPFPFFVVLYIVIILKFLKERHHQKIFYYFGFISLLVLMVILRSLTGFDFNEFMKYDIAILLIPILPTFLKNADEINSFLKLIFIGLLIVFAGQFYHILTGDSFSGALFGAGRVEYSKMIERDVEGLVRSVEGILIPLISLIGVVFLYSIGRGPRYHQVVAFISFISIWFTATRGWMLASSVIILPYLFYLNRGQFSRSIITLLIFVAIISQVGILNRQMRLATDRLETVEFIAKGDITAGGTLKRLDVRGPRVMQKWSESPIFGYGYSEEFKEYRDGHVGNQNLLLQVGIFGVIIFLTLIISVLYSVFITGSRYKNARAPSFTILAAIFGVILIHSTSRQMFGLGGDYISQFSIAFVFLLANYFYYNAHELSFVKKVY